jgi:hypothetical protein
VAGQKVDEIPLRIARQCRFGEMRVAGEIGPGFGIEIGEIAAPATGDADLFRRASGMIDHQNRAAFRGSEPCAKQPGSTRAQNDRIDMLHGLV